MSGGVPRVVFPPPSSPDQSPIGACMLLLRPPSAQMHTRPIFAPSHPRREKLNGRSSKKKTTTSMQSLIENKGLL